MLYFELRVTIYLKTPRSRRTINLPVLPPHCIFICFLSLHAPFTRIFWSRTTCLSDVTFLRFLGLLQKWRYERQKLAEAFAVPGQRSFASGVGPSLRGHSSLVCERIVVMNKRDLVPEWGIEVRFAEKLHMFYFLPS